MLQNSEAEAAKLAAMRPEDRKRHKAQQRKVCQLLAYPTRMESVLEPQNAAS